MIVQNLHTHMLYVAYKLPISKNYNTKTFNCRVLTPKISERF